MLAKSAASVLRYQSSSQLKVAALTTAHQRSFAGGGPKKPAMPATETNFDVVFVGNTIYSNLHDFRWHERCSSSQVLAVRWS